MAQIMPKYHLACRRGGAFCKSIVSTARRGGVPFVRTKGTKIRLGLRPKTPTRRYTPPGKPKRRHPGAGLDDAYKAPQAHFM